MAALLEVTQEIVSSTGRGKIAIKNRSRSFSTRASTEKRKKCKKILAIIQMEAKFVPEKSEVRSVGNLCIT